MCALSRGFHRLSVLPRKDGIHVAQGFRNGTVVSFRAWMSNRCRDIGHLQ